MHGLEPVAHVGQRAVHDGRERVSEVALFERLAQVDGLDRTSSGQNRFVAHGRQLPARELPGKPTGCGCMGMSDSDDDWSPRASPCGKDSCFSHKPQDAVLIHFQFTL